MFLTAETDFGLAMLRQLPLNASAVVSPISVIFSLAMLQAGARGKTKAEIDELIAKGALDDSITHYLSNLSSEILNATDGVQTRIANGFFLNEQFDIKKDYKEKIINEYHAKVEALDFHKTEKTIKTINDFVNETTNGKLHYLVNADAVKDAFSLVINAIYFTAEWLMKFYKSSNSKALFYSAQASTREIEFMNDFEVHRQYAEDDEVEVLSLPYKDVSYAFNIILPKKRFGFGSARSKLDGARIQKLLSQLKETYVTIETDFKLKDALMNMGVTEVFSDSADLSRIASDPPLKVSEAAHKAIIEVDEEGTTAAAATLFKIIPMMAIMERPKLFVADHPFIFLLTKNNNPLFIGQFV
uniref:SERPIN domain-containing protein n=1 Tax=Angiostrongylus cantonensis TaxID=6313 RepID=A0A158PAS3_ANGCA